MSDNSATFTEAGPRSPSRYRPGYTRIVSTPEHERAHHGIGHHDDGGEDFSNTYDRPAASYGLGIGATPPSLGLRRGSVQTIPIRSVGVDSSPGLTITNSGDPFLSPLDRVRHSAGFNVVDEDAGGSYYRSPNATSYRAKSSVSSLPSSIQEPDERRLSGGGGTFVKSAYDGTYRALQTKRPGLM